MAVIIKPRKASGPSANAPADSNAKPSGPRATPMRPMTAESTITSKGQTTVPAEIRDALDAKPGTKMVWHVMPNGRVIVRFKWRSALDLAGMLNADRHLTIEEMNPFRDEG